MGRMRQEELIALTANAANVPEDEAARVLAVAAELRKAAQSGEPGEPSDAGERAALAAALRKADEAFGGGDGSRASRLAYSERSGLLG
jgi:hypothetical protein